MLPLPPLHTLPSGLFCSAVNLLGGFESQSYKVCEYANLLYKPQEWVQPPDVRLKTRQRVKMAPHTQKNVANSLAVGAASRLSTWLVSRFCAIVLRLWRLSIKTSVLSRCAIFVCPVRPKITPTDKTLHPTPPSPFAEGPRQCFYFQILLGSENPFRGMSLFEIAKKLRRGNIFRRKSLESPQKRGKIAY